MATELSSVVGRFCAQLKREGYRVERELVGAFHVISACEEDGPAVVQYIACTEEDGVHIEAVD